ncbi:MAG TPA: MlaD family protein [Verrucomicrobiae bacterium]|nr:MlaD family protein [Verrucomicrobiae bacterium]
MTKTRFAKRVGLFVVIALGVLVALVVIFTKSGGFKPTYELRMRAETVANLKKGSLVLMAGVPIGGVSDVDLVPGGKGVIIRAKIQQKYKIHADAQFRIEQLGFLGDQFISVYPQANAAPVLGAGAEVRLEQPFDLQQTARSATELVDEVKVIVKSLNDLAVRVDQKVLSDRNLTNVDLTLNNLAIASDKVITMVDGINTLVETNSGSIFVSVSNLVHFSEQLNTVATELSQFVATNRTELTKAINSLDNTAGTLERLAQSVDKGEGLAGALLKDDQLKNRIMNIAENLQTVSSNISRFGLLHKPKQSKQPQSPPYPGKSSVK